MRRRIAIDAGERTEEKRVRTAIRRLNNTVLLLLLFQVKSERHCLLLSPQKEAALLLQATDAEFAYL